MRTVMLNVLTFFLFAQTKSQTQPFTGMAGITVYDQSGADAFSFTQNQAGLTNVHSILAGIYGERIFMIPELANYLLAIALPLPAGNIGLCFSRFGSKGYAQSRIGIAYARSIDKKIDIGVQFNYHRIRIDGYGSSAAPGFEIGSIFHFSERFRFGLHTVNPVGGKFGLNREEKLPTIIETGFGYRPSETFFMTAILVKQESMPLNVKVGFDYQLHSKIKISAGINTATGAYWFGAGLLLSRLTVSFYSSMHSRLGPTPGLMLNYEIFKTSIEQQLN
jgi:hypothetical protein